MLGLALGLGYRQRQRQQAVADALRSPPAERKPAPAAGHLQAARDCARAENWACAVAMAQSVLAEDGSNEEAKALLQKMAMIQLGIDTRPTPAAERAAVQPPPAATPPLPGAASGALAAAASAAAASATASATARSGCDAIGGATARQGAAADALAALGLCARASVRAAHAPHVDRK